MFAITVKQPFANRIMRGVKTREYRSWPTTHRGIVAIHAGTARDALSLCDAGEDAATLPRGALLGTVEIVGCEWDQATNCYAWILANPKPIAAPMVCKGALRFWNVPEPLAATLEN